MAGNVKGRRPTAEASTSSIEVQGPVASGCPGPEIAGAEPNKGVSEGADIIAYCRIGERSAHSWFALHELLGEQKVRNYDGSWTEWGNMVDVPIEKG